MLVILLIIILILNNKSAKYLLVLGDVKTWEYLPATISQGQRSVGQVLRTISYGGHHVHPMTSMVNEVGHIVTVLSPVIFVHRVVGGMFTRNI